MTSLFCRRRSTSDNFDQLASNDSLSSSVKENLESVDHVASILGGVIHGVTTSGVLTSVAFGQSLFHRGWLDDAVVKEWGTWDLPSKWYWPG